MNLCQVEGIIPGISVYESYEQWLSETAAARHWMLKKLNRITLIYRSQVQDLFQMSFTNLYRIGIDMAH